MALEYADAQTARLAITEIIRLIGDDPGREGLVGTPDRVVRSWATLYGGYAADPAAVLAATFDAEGYDELVVLRGVTFASTCEHHLLPFCGSVDIGYLPGPRVVGVSKLARLVEVFARRLQIQERMTRQIADAMVAALRPRGVAVVARAQHMCMTTRGVERREAEMVTSAMTGDFLTSPELRAEFLTLTHRT